MRTPRLPAENFDFTIGKSETNPGFHGVLSIARHPKTNHIKEFAAHLTGRCGSDLNALLNDFCVALSRAVQHRDPDTGERLTE